MWKKKESKARFGAVIVAGGSSSRMEGIDKQGLWLGDMSVLVRSILPFTHIDEVHEIVIVTREELIPQVMDWVKDFDLEKVTSIVRGGNSRQQSVLKGIEALSDQVDYFTIHDGARPFVDHDVICRCMEAALEHGAATAAVPSKDTIKVADRDGFIAATPDRSTLYLTQTPQIFRRDWYLEAVEQAKADGVDCTDDCQLVERLGRKVYLSMGSYFNIKITTPHDIPFAEAIVGALEGEKR